jgi:large subunit ribosomal protein L18
VSLKRKLAERKRRRTLRVRSSFKASELPRLSVFRSAKHIYGQIINDFEGNTIVSCSSLEEIVATGDKKAIAYATGIALAKKALAKGVEKVAFDRGSFLYHGRIKAFADGLREGGLIV